MRFFRFAAVFLIALTISLAAAMCCAAYSRTEPWKYDQAAAFENKSVLLLGREWVQIGAERRIGTGLGARVTSVAFAPASSEGSRESDPQFRIESYAFGWPVPCVYYDEILTRNIDKAGRKPLLPAIEKTLRVKTSGHYFGSGITSRQRPSPVPIAVRFSGLLVNTTLFFAVFIAAALAGRAVVRRRRAREHRCTRCGYPLGQAARCPECGHGAAASGS